jgi:hypothetical protein
MVYQRILKNETEYLRHPGYGVTLDNECLLGYDSLFNTTTFEYIKSELKKLLSNVTTRPIIVADNVIQNVLENLFIHNTPQAIGDIYSKYHMVGKDLDCKRANDVSKIVQETIEVIYNYIKNEYEMIDCNNNMTAWNALYGAQNPHGLLAHPPIKVLEKRPMPMQFEMRY